MASAFKFSWLLSFLIPGAQMAVEIFDLYRPLLVMGNLNVVH